MSISMSALTLGTDLANKGKGTILVEVGDQREALSLYLSLKH